MIREILYTTVLQLLKAAGIQPRQVPPAFSDSHEKRHCKVDTDAGLQRVHLCHVKLHSCHPTIHAMQLGRLHV